MTSPSESIRLCIIGDIAMDVHVGMAGAFPTDVNVNGNTPSLVELIPGGAAANTALWARASGSSVRLISTIGEDLIGEALQEHLAAFGVDGFLELIPDVPSGSVVVVSDATGARTMFPSPGTNEYLSQPWVLAGLCGQHVHVNGYGLARTATRQTYLNVIREARTRGMSVSYDVASFEIVREHWASVESAARLSDVVFLNDDEWRASPPATLRNLSEDRLVVHMMGALGCEAWQGDQRWSIPAPNIEIADTVGAGDAFTAGFLSRFIQGENVADCLKQARAVAGACVARVGACPALPTLKG